MYVDLRSSIGRGIFVTGEFDIKSFEPALAVLKPGDVVLDIGANVGFFTMMALDRIGPSGRSYCFEIDKRPLRALSRTISTFNLSNIEIVEAAVFNQDGMVAFAPSKDHGNSQIEHAQAGKLAVKAVRLDTWVRERDLRRVDVIKIDIEGAERFALEGAAETLRRFMPVILCEASHLTERFDYRADDLAAMLQKMGYETRWLDGVWSPTLYAEPRGVLPRSSAPMDPTS